MSDSSCELLDRWRRNDSAAAAALVDRYIDRLLALARSRLSSKLARRIDAEDVVQSVYRSFFVQAREGQVAAERPGDLWRLLATITLHKVARQARRHQAARRSVDREAVSEASGSDPVATLLDREPSVVDVVAAAEQLRWLFTQLEPGARSAVRLRLENHTLDEIAGRLGRSERTIRRWLDQVKQLLATRLADEQHSGRDDMPHGASRGLVAGRVDANAPLKHSDYHLERLIGSGGMSKVYLAVERRTGRRVVVKVLRKRLRRQPKTIERFLQEASIVARIAHPNIVPIHGAGRMPDGGYFLVMDYIDGGDLTAICSRGPLDPQRAARIVVRVAEAVQQAHANGVVHRDLKPGNVLVDSAGNVFTTDFGFAWQSTAGGGDNSVAGTIGFMAPEQIDSGWGEIGPYTDVYGLGALLVALLAGRPSPAALLRSESLSHVGSPTGVIVWESLTAGVPSPLGEICRRCLAPRWQERFATAQALAEALQDWLATASW